MDHTDALGARELDFSMEASGDARPTGADLRSFVPYRTPDVVLVHAIFGFAAARGLSLFRRR